MLKFAQNRSALRAAALAAIAFGLVGCGSVSAPELSEVKLLPEMRSFLPSNSNTYASATAMRTLGPASPQDLVDAQGLCAGMPAPAPASSEPGALINPAAQPTPPAQQQPVTLEMTECQVVGALGVPARTEIGTGERGERSATLTFAGGERAGIYRFNAGRLASIERGPEPPAPPKPEKKPAKKATPAKKQAKPAA
jgi:hypothetical protein